MKSISGGEYFWWRIFLVESTSGGEYFLWRVFRVESISGKEYFCVNVWTFSTNSQLVLVKIGKWDPANDRCAVTSYNLVLQFTIAIANSMRHCLFHTYLQGWGAGKFFSGSGSGSLFF